MSDLRKSLLHNLGLKFLSVAIAFALWFAVAGEPIAEAGFNVPVEFHNVPEKLEIVTEELPQVQVRVRGADRLLRTIGAGDVHAELDLGELSRAKPGERTYDLTAAQIRVPEQLEVVQVVPSHLRISFDRRLAKQVEIQPRAQGELPPGYRLVSLTCEPKSVVIVGPERRVAPVTEALTDPVDVSGVAGRASFTTTAYVPDTLVRLTHPTSVRVTVVTEKTP